MLPWPRSQIFLIEAATQRLVSVLPWHVRNVALSTFSHSPPLRNQGHDSAKELTEPLHGLARFKH
jgi:hypothetical protein